MKSRRTICAALLLLMLIAGAASLFSGCSGGKNDSRNVVYDDMKEAFERSDMLSANIGIFSKTEKDGNISCCEGGSGVIFKKDGGSYYALTAAHVVSTDDAELLVFTVNTEMKAENVPEAIINVLAPETYDAMYTAELTL